MITEEKKSQLSIARNAFFGTDAFKNLKNKIFEAFNRIIIPELKKSRIKPKNIKSNLKIMFSYKTNEVLIFSDKELESYQESSNLILDDLLFISEINMDYFKNHQLFSSIFEEIHYSKNSDNSEQIIKDKVDKLFTKRVFSSISESFLELSKIDFDEVILQDTDFPNTFDYDLAQKAKRIQTLILGGNFPVRFFKKNNLSNFFLKWCISDTNSQEFLNSDRYIDQELRDLFKKMISDKISSLKSLTNKEFFTSLKELGAANFISIDDIIFMMYKRLQEIKESKEAKVNVKSYDGLQSIIQSNSLLRLNHLFNGKDVIDSISEERLLELFEISTNYKDYFDSDFIEHSRILFEVFSTMCRIIISEFKNRNYSDFSKVSIPFYFISDLNKESLEWLSTINEIEITYLKPHEIIFSLNKNILNNIEKFSGKITIPKDTEFNLNLFLDSIEKGAVFSSNQSTENQLKLIKKIISS